MTTPSLLPLRVLIVDDLPDTATSLALLVRLWGHHAVAARDGPQALRLAQAERPDVVLLDLALPEMDGYEVARRVRADPLLAGVRLVAVTGYGDGEHRQRAGAAGFDLFFLKPLDLDALRRLLEVSATRPPPLAPQGLAALLTSLATAAEVIEEILDEPAQRAARGWPFLGWSFECVPWGVRFLRREGGRLTASVVALAMPEDRRASVEPAYLSGPCPTTVLLLG